MPEKRMITVELTPDEAELVRASALADSRTPTGYVRALVHADLKIRGFMDEITNEITQRGQDAITALPPNRRQGGVRRKVTQ